jgi:hypothetical protein
MLTFTQPLPLKGARLLSCAPEQEAVQRVLLVILLLANLLSESLGEVRYRGWSHGNH